MKLPRELTHPTSFELREGWRQVLSRPAPDPGKRQKAFVPVETLAAYFASKVVNHRSYGGSTAHAAPTPVPQLAKLGGRPRSSILAKMANLDMSRVNGAKHDGAWGSYLDALSTEEFSDLYRRMIGAARSLNIDAFDLPDFLALEVGGTWSH
ncbi:hypothetical protein [Nocardioides yefusunii]|uniref:Uncharacterized protein n=1 Tax=Nocardioides yefusunii TaxID=2500546 RepID=A0ABW1R0C7_9ACTN|nr:hypothetical protein [Nocardioides yefusunii]